MQITRSSTCGNSPKNTFAQDVAIALASGDKGFLEAALDENCLLEPANGEAVSGPDAILALLGEGIFGEPERIAIDMAITHGKHGAVNGTVSDGQGETGFCLALRFRNTKAELVSALTLYRR